MQRAFLRFRPGSYQGPVNVIMPAVIATDQTMFCDNAIFKGCPMDAVFVEKAEITGFIPKQDQVFPSKVNVFGRSPSSDDSITGCQNRRYSPQAYRGQHG